MNHLADKSLGPPGGWKYTQPESGVLFQGISWAQLVDKVRKHRVSNRYDAEEGWGERFENEFCEQNNLVGTRWCPCGDTEPKPDRTVGVAELKRFLSSALSMLMHGKDIFVAQEEADRRAAVCAGCPKNSHIPGCFGCNGVRALISKIKGSRTTDQDSRLRQCAVCGCDNSVKVWLKEEVVDNQGLDYPDHCWNHTLEDAGTAGKPPR